jgi:excisionase family DNA binding protein
MPLFYPDASERTTNKKTHPQRLASSDQEKPLAYSMAELAQAWGVSERSVWSLVNSGRLPSFRIGRLVRIPREAADAFMANGGKS